MAGPTNWLLFVDESGNFESADSGPVPVVVGLLIDEHRPGVTPKALREAITAGLPEVPWPPHATELRLGVRFALWADALEGPLQPKAREALRVLQEASPASLREVRQALNKGGKADRAQVQALDRLLQQRAPKLHRVFADRWPAVRDHLSSVVTSALAAPVGAAEACGLLVASGSRRGVPIPSGDWYLAHLDVLLERVVDLLDRRGGEHVVRVWVARRDVVPARLGVPTPLHPLFVKDLAEAAMERVQGSKRAVRLVAAATPAYDADVPPGIVLADFVANGLLPIGGQLQYSLEQVERLAREDRGVRLRLTRPGLPAAVAVLAQPRIREARAGRDLPEPSGLGRWAREQAEEWVRALAREAVT